MVICGGMWEALCHPLIAAVLQGSGTNNHFTQKEQKVPSSHTLREAKRAVKDGADQIRQGGYYRLHLFPPHAFPLMCI